MNLLDEEIKKKKGKNTNITMRIILICKVRIEIEEDNLLNLKNEFYKKYGYIR